MPDTSFILASSSSVSVGEGNKVEARLVKEGSGQQPGDRHMVEAVCQGLGQTTLTLTVANTPSVSLPHPKKVRDSREVSQSVSQAVK